MQANQQAGLDLPQKMLAWESAEGEVRLGYNSASYLQARHALEGVDDPLDTIATALEGLAGNATGSQSAGGGANTESEPEAGLPEAGQGIITVGSTQDMDATFDALRAAIDNAEPLSEIAMLDHAENAQSVGLELPPTRLVVFGNPNAGTPLMQASQTIGVDLPQKMLVYADAQGAVSIAYNDPAYLAARHGVTGQDELLTQIRSALDNLANTAAGIATETAPGTDEETDMDSDAETDADTDADSDAETDSETDTGTETETDTDTDTGTTDG